MSSCTLIEPEIGWCLLEPLLHSYAIISHWVYAGNQLNQWWLSELTVTGFNKNQWMLCVEETYRRIFTHISFNWYHFAHVPNGKCTVYRFMRTYWHKLERVCECQDKALMSRFIFHLDCFMFPFNSITECCHSNTWTHTILSRISFAHRDPIDRQYFFSLTASTLHIHTHTRIYLWRYCIDV